MIDDSLISFPLAFPLCPQHAICPTVGEAQHSAATGIDLNGLWVIIDRCFVSTIPRD